jgi:hypothetical protein
MTVGVVGADVYVLFEVLPFDHQYSCLRWVGVNSFEARSGNIGLGICSKHPKSSSTKT